MVRVRVRNYRKTGPVPKTNRERFDEFVSPEPMSGCHLWTGGVGIGGYGKFGWRCSTGKFRTDIAHRAAYVLEHGWIPWGKVICHKCHNRLCVNPDHLYAGTQQDNINDELARGTHISQSSKRARGERVNTAKLKSHQPGEIRHHYMNGDKVSDLAKLYRVSKATIYAIISNKIWKEEVTVA